MPNGQRREAMIDKRPGLQQDADNLHMAVLGCTVQRHEAIIHRLIDRCTGSDQRCDKLCETVPDCRKQQSTAKVARQGGLLADCRSSCQQDVGSMFVAILGCHE